MSEAVGAIIAAIIAGLVAFFSLIISKEQTVSAFRQQWVDELRKDIATLASHVSSIYGASVSKHKDARELWERTKTDLPRFNEVIVRIRLRLNPNERRKREGPATKAVLDALAELDVIFASPTPQFPKLEILAATLVANANVILKENWQRVRAGEPIYRATKWSTLGLTIAVFLVLLFKWLK